jgi:hypothetical protein
MWDGSGINLSSARNNTRPALDGQGNLLLTYRFMPQKNTKPTAPHSRINFPLPNKLRDAVNKKAHIKGMTTRGLIVVLLTEWLKEA